MNNHKCSLSISINDFAMWALNLLPYFVAMVTTSPRLTVIARWNIIHVHLHGRWMLLYLTEACCSTCIYIMQSLNNNNWNSCYKTLSVSDFSLLYKVNWQLCNDAYVRMVYISYEWVYCYGETSHNYSFNLHIELTFVTRCIYDSWNSYFWTTPHAIKWSI